LHQLISSVGLSLSFKTTTAYARYWEARSAWQTIASQSRSLARLITVHVPESTAKDCFVKKSALDVLNLYPHAAMLHLRERRADGAELRQRVPLLVTYASLTGSPAVSSLSTRSSIFRRLKQHRAEAVDYNQETALHGCLPAGLCILLMNRS
jgi:predicted membrane chloride channel (bestrophin family)